MYGAYFAYCSGQFVCHYLLDSSFVAAVSFTLQYILEV
jgi:hypothetical protein